MSSIIKTSKYAIGIDIGGTKMYAVLFNGEKIIADCKLATPKDSLENFFVMLKALVDPLLKKSQTDKVKIAGIGLGIAGALNHDKTKNLVSPNIPFLNNIKIAEEFQKRMDLPVAMDNDANCMLRAEALLGYGKKFNNIYGVILGTGIGGAWWRDNDIYTGSHGGENEPGEMIINFDNNLKFEDAYHQLFQNDPARFADMAYRGDELAKKKFDEFGRMLGLALANITNLLDPEAYIVSGGLTEVEDLYFKTAEKTMHEYTNSPDARGVKIIKAKYKNDAGAIGAALLAK